MRCYNTYIPAYLPKHNLTNFEKDDCKNPIIHENLGFGEGDHGDPNSPYFKNI